MDLNGSIVSTSITHAPTSGWIAVQSIALLADQQQGGNG
jgi:hypothetical protein